MMMDFVHTLVRIHEGRTGQLRVSTSSCSGRRATLRSAREVHWFWDGLLWLGGSGRVAAGLMPVSEWLLGNEPPIDRRCYVTATPI